MALLVLAIVSLGTVAFSFAFSFLVFAAWREERRTGAFSDAQRRGRIETMADRALAEVGRLFVVDDPRRSNTDEPAVQETKQPDADQPYSAPMLPQRPPTDRRTPHAL